MPCFRSYSGPSGKHLAYFKHHGRLYSKVVKNKREGRKWRLQKEKELESQTNQENSLMFSTACKLYLQHCSTRGMRHNTIREKLCHYRGFASFMGNDFCLLDLTLAKAQLFLDEIVREKRPQTANRYLRNLKALWNWRSLELPNNIWREIEMYSETEFVKYVPPSEDVEAIRSIASEIERDFIDLILKTGARRGEVLDLMWNKIDFALKTIKLGTRKSKNGNLVFRTMSMTPGLFNLLERRERDNISNNAYVFFDLQSGKKLNPDQHIVKNMMKKLCIKAGVKPFGFHALRHFVAWKLDRSRKVSLTEIQHFLGHERATTTNDYLKTIGSNLEHLDSILDD